MGKEILLSVVIPVFNAENFIQTALDSVLQFDEVDEVVFVDDGSKDGSLALLREIELSHSKVKIHTHPEGKNLGAGPTRSLGVKQANGKWIAFLDVDDVFLPNRFDRERELIFAQENNSIDGVYGAVGSHYIEEAKASEFNLDLTTVSATVPPEELKYTLLQISKKYTGYFHLIALTVRKSLVEKIGYFATNLALKQDTDFCIKLALMGQLHSGTIDEAIGSRGIHRNNRISKMTFPQHLVYKEIMLNNLKVWMQEKGVSDERSKLHVSKELDVLAFINRSNYNLGIFESFKFFRNRPDIFFDNKLSELIIHAIFGRNTLGRFIVRLKEKIVLTFFKSKT